MIVIHLLTEYFSSIFCFLLRYNGDILHCPLLLLLIHLPPLGKSVRDELLEKLLSTFAQFLITLL